VGASAAAVRANLLLALRLLAYAQLYRALGGGWALTDAQFGRGRHEVKRRSSHVRCMLLTTLGIVVFAGTALAQPSLPSTFRARTVASPEGASIFVRSGGSGPAVVLLHGYAETSDSWGPLATALAKNYTVVVPDLRGIGRSSRPAGGSDKKTQAADIRAVVTTLGYDRTSVVSHDIGIMVAYAYAASYGDKVDRLVVMDAPLPGIAPWDDIVRNPALWHFSFRGPDAERLVRGRERIYLDRIWNAFTGDPRKPDEATRAYYAAQYAQPGAMRAGFAQFTAFAQDAEDTESSSARGSPCPCWPSEERSLSARHRQSSCEMSPAMSARRWSQVPATG
jgi:pimeloyl-ACP methyl ester carboxylesterase